MKKYIGIVMLFVFWGGHCQDETNSLQISKTQKISFLDSLQSTIEINEDRVNGFFEDVSVIDMSVQMKKNCPDRKTCLEEYQDFLSKDVESFTEEEIEVLKVIYGNACNAINEINPDILPAEVQLIKTKGTHYGNSVYYTRENTIVIPKNELEGLKPDGMTHVTYHELFHVISRYNSGLKDKLYSLIGFHKIDKPVEMPEVLKNRLLLNPDGIEVQYMITLEDTVRNKSINTIPLILTAENQFDPAKPAFFAYLKFELFELIDQGKNYSTKCNDDGFSTFPFKNAGNFHSQIKDNTGYIIHPDEIMADNFTFLFTVSEEERKTKFSKEGQKLLSQVEDILKGNR